MTTPIHIPAKHPDSTTFELFRKHGFSPKCIVDGGASTGLWSQSMALVFPDAQFHLFEPAADFEPLYRDGLQTAVANHSNFTLHKVALGATAGSIHFYQSESGPWGSTTLDMQGTANFKRFDVPVERLEDLIASGKVPQPDLVKVDIQGGELDVLKGLGRYLPHVSFLTLETWLAKSYGQKVPLYHELVSFLLQYDIHLVDLSDGWRDADGFLVSQDMVFASAKCPVVARYWLT